MAGNPHLSPGAGTMALFRVGDLAALSAYPGIPWTTVRATTRGRRAPPRKSPCTDRGRPEFMRISVDITGHQLGYR